MASVDICKIDAFVAGPLDRNEATPGGSGGLKKPGNKPKIEYVCVAQLDRATAS